MCPFQIPEKMLEHKPRRKRNSLVERNSVHTRNPAADVSPSNRDVGGADTSSILPAPSPPTPQNTVNRPDTAYSSDSDSDEDHATAIPVRRPPHSRRLSMFESEDGLMDFESDCIGGSARQHRTLGRSL
jgi:hypothetical protein